MTTISKERADRIEKAAFAQAEAQQETWMVVSESVAYAAAKTMDEAMKNAGIEYDDWTQARAKNLNYSCLYVLEGLLRDTLQEAFYCPPDPQIAAAEARADYLQGDGGDDRDE